MKKTNVMSNVITKISMLVDYVVVTLVICFMWVIVDLQTLFPLSPILWLFQLCFWIGHPLFVRFALKKRWFECIKDYYLSLKYITIPWLVMELLVMLCYPHETMMIIKSF